MPVPTTGTCSPRVVRPSHRVAEPAGRLRLRPEGSRAEGGRGDAGHAHPSGRAHDQRAVETRADVLSYTSGVLRSVHGVGAVSVTLFAASSAPDTDFVARLVEISRRPGHVHHRRDPARVRSGQPIGIAVVVPARPTPIEHNAVYEYRIDLWATGITFLPGTASGSTSRPARTRAGTANRHRRKAYDSAATAVARQRIFHDPDRLSRLTLTMVG